MTEDLSIDNGSSPARRAADAQLTRETEAIGKALRDGHITASEAHEMTEAAGARHRIALALAALDEKYPPWHAWVGAIPMLYARRPRSSPPCVVRGTTPRTLENEIILTEARLRETGRVPACRPR